MSDSSEDEMFQDIFTQDGFLYGFDLGQPGKTIELYEKQNGEAKCQAVIQVVMKAEGVYHAMRMKLPAHHRVMTGGPVKDDMEELRLEVYNYRLMSVTPSTTLAGVEKKLGSDSNGETTNMDAKKMDATKMEAKKQPDLLRKIVSGNTEFAIDLLKELCTLSEGNVFFSPMSISVALAMTYLGAKANTAVEMKNGLKLAPLSDEDIHSGYEELSASLETDESRGFVLNIANRIFTSNELKREFLEATKKYYKAEAQTLDFASDSEGSRQVINKWVEGKTANKIQDLIPSESLNAQTSMVLVNAIYFIGRWEEEFMKSATKVGQFKLSGGQEVDADLMFMCEFLLYGEDSTLDCKIVELHYRDHGASMFIILPNKYDGLAELTGQLDDSKLAELTTKLGEYSVELTLPKFKLEDTVSLNGVLKSLGMKDMFIDGRADFSGMDGTKKLYVSSVVHKSFIDVNEEGTEAAAATAIKIVPECCRLANEYREFRADHPFLFFIRDNRTKGILFMGCLANPMKIQ